MTMFRFSPEMKKMILEAKKRGGKTTCDPRAMYPVGHRCAPTTQPVHITGNGRPAPQKSKPLVMPIWAKGKPLPPWVQRDPRAMPPVPTNGVVTDAQPTGDGGAVITTRGDNGDTVTASVDENGAVREVEVKRLFDNPLVPIALGAAALLLLGG